MIALHGVSKRYGTDPKAPWVLRNVSLRVPNGVSVGVLGPKGSGKSTLMRLLTAHEEPTEGKVEVLGRLSYPSRYMRQLQPLLTGRQNARFICRVSGYEHDLEDRLQRVEAIARLGSRLGLPVKQYKAALKMRLSFALSWALDSDVYVVDAFSFTGDNAFPDKATAEAELVKKLRNSAMIMAAQGRSSYALLRKYCQAGILVHAGSATWFDRIDDALAAARAVDPRHGEETSKKNDAEGLDRIAEPLRPSAVRVRRLQNALTVLARGLAGRPAVVDARQMPFLMKAATGLGLELAPAAELLQRGLAPLPDAVPLLRVSAAQAPEVDYFDATLQCAPATPAVPLQVSPTEGKT